MIQLEHEKRRKIRLIEGSAKCRHLKKLTCKGTLRQVFTVYISEAQNPIPPPPLLRTVYKRVYNTVYLFTHGKGEGGRELRQREDKRATVHKAGSKYQHD